MARPIAQLALCLGVALLAGQSAVGQAPPSGAPPNSDYNTWSEAVRKGDAATVERLLSTRPSLALQSGAFGNRWLHVAADAGHEGVVAALIEAKADVNAPGDTQTSAGTMQTPLHLAARRGHAGVVRRLLAAGSDVNAREFSRNTPLHLALQPRENYRGVEQLASQSETNRAGRIETIRLLCQAGADLFAFNRYYNRSNSPVQAASSPGQEQWLDLLLTNARPRTVRAPDGRSLLDIARHHERFDAMLALSLPEQAAPVGELSPLHALVFKSPPGPRQADGVRLEPRRYWELLAAGHAPDLFTRVGLEDVAGVRDWLRDNPNQLARLRDAEGRTPLHWALTKGFPDVAALLLEHGADATAVDASGRTPLLLIVETGQIELLQKLKPLAVRALNDDTFPLSPLELALLKGQGAMVDALLELQPKVNRPCLTGGTLLHLAARKASVSVTEKLLALGVDPKLRDHRQRTPLHLAVTSGNGLQVAALLKGGSPLDAEDEDGRLPLHEAARLGHAELLPGLLPPVALVHRPDKSGRTALELAVQGGHESAADFLLRRKPDLNRRGPGGATLLHLAVQARKPDLVVRLLTAGADVALTDERDRTPLHTAAELGLEDLLIKLANARADTSARDRDGRTALDLALAGGHTSAARFLTKLEDWRPDPAARRTTPLHRAAAAGQLDLVKELLPLSPTPDLLDERGQTPLALAAAAGHFALVPPLVERGADVNATNAAGHTPLLSALLRENWTQALALLELGADLNRSDTNGNTALHLAFRKSISNTAASGWLAEFERLMKTNALPTNTTFSAWLRTNDPLVTLDKEVALRRADGKPFNPEFDNVREEPWKFVLAMGADPRATNHLGQTPLHSLATQNNFYSSTHGSRVEVIVAALIRRGADPNARDAAGRTALLEAVQRGGWQIVQALANHGADINATARDGQTALVLALQEPWPHSGVASAIQALVQLSADVNARDTNGQTVLHHFSRFGGRDLDSWTGPCLTELLKAKPDLNAQDHQGDTALHLAVRVGRANLANHLNGQGANPLLRNKAGESAMELVAKTPKSPFHSFNLLPPGAKSTAHAAAEGGDLESLKVWFALDTASVVQPTNAANPLLVDAASNRHTNVVNFLLTNGAQLNSFVALLTGRTNEMAELLRTDPAAARTEWRHAKRTVSYTNYFANGSSWGTTTTVPARAPLLHHAVAFQDESVLNLVLAAKPDVNAADSSGFTALYHSLTNGTEGLTARLRTAGAVENAYDLIAQNKITQLKSIAARALADASTNQPGTNLLRFAVLRTNVAAVNLLLAAGADPNLAWPFSQTPFSETNAFSSLHAAVALEQVELAQALIEAGARVNGFDGSGMAPLHLAAWRGQTAMITLLLRHGADPNARLTWSPAALQRPSAYRAIGNTPLHTAAQYGQTNSIVLLVKAGADLERTNNFGLTPLANLRSPDFPGPGRPPQAFLGGPPSMSVAGLQGQSPASRASRDEVIHLLRSLGAKESVVGQPFGYPSFGPARPLPSPPAPAAQAAPTPAVPAKPPEPKPRE